MRDKFFIIIDRHKTLGYDSKVGSKVLKSLSLKSALTKKDTDSLISYMRLTMIDPMDRKIIGKDNLRFYSIKLLAFKRIENKSMF